MLLLECFPTFASVMANRSYLLFFFGFSKEPGGMIAWKIRLVNKKPLDAKSGGFSYL